jgi:hypothetical protein
MIRGGLVLALIMSSMLFLWITGEGLLGFSSGVRTGLMAVLGAVFLGVGTFWILIPLSKFLNISKPITDREVAQFVRKEIPNVDDKLLNLLELQGQVGDGQSVLLMAAIQKRTEEMAPIPFSKAINLQVNWKFARYLAIPAALFLLVGLLRPDVLSNGTTRLVNFNKDFIPPPPFEIHVGNHPNQLVAGERFKLESSVEGEELPSELFLYVKKASESEYIHYPMEKLRADAFWYEFGDIKENFNYKIGNQEVMTEPFGVEVLNRPAIRNFKAVLDFPAYTGMKDDTLSENVGDFKVLRGTKVRWIVEPNSPVRSATYVGGDTAEFKPTIVPGKFFHEKQILDNEQYYIQLLSQRNIANIDTTRYNVEIVQDRFPTVFVNAKDQVFQADFSMYMPLDFEISDDYGFSKLVLNYRFTKSDEETKVSENYNLLNLKVDYRTLLQRKSLEIDLQGLGMEEGDMLEYFVKIWDNDMVSGPKSSTSAIFKVNFPSLDEKFDEVADQQDKLAKEMESLVKDAKEVQEGIEKFQDKLLDQKTLSFDDKKELSKLVEKHQSMESRIEQAKKEFKEHKENLENNQMVTQRTMEKYQKLNDLMDKLNNKELNQYMEKLKKEMEKMNPQDLKQMMEKMEMSQEDLEKALERTTEMMKQLEAEQKSEEIVQKLDNMQKKQDMLNEKLENSPKKDDQQNKELADKQKELSKEMDGIKKDLEKLDELKKETGTPEKEKMDELKKDAEETEQQMQDAGEQIEQSDKKSGSESQKNSSKKMEEMKEQLKSMSSSGQSKQDEQNMEDLRDLLENLLKLSFKQEDIRDEMRNIRANDPQLFAKEVEQKQIFDDMEMVKDSLDELAKRVFQIEKFVTDESNKIIQSMKAASEAMESKYIPMVTENQHKAMTSINNLANMLTDVMDQMQQQMKNQKGGQSQCQKPGGGKPNMQNISKQQGKLNSMMQQLMNGQGTDPKKLAEMAKMQEMIRQQMKEAHEQIQKGGGEKGGLGDMGKIMQDMKDTEDELNNQILTERTLKRQQQIMNRLLDSMKAVREKEEFEERRESNTGFDKEKKSPDQLELEEYKNRIRQELLKSNQLEYSTDFIILIEKYFKLLENANE